MYKGHNLFAFNSYNIYYLTLESRSSLAKSVSSLSATLAISFSTSSYQLFNIIVVLDRVKFTFMIHSDRVDTGVLCMKFQPVDGRHHLL